MCELTNRYETAKYEFNLSTSLRTNFLISQFRIFVVYFVCSDVFLVKSVINLCNQYYMGLPSKQRTKRSQRERRAHHALSKITVVYDAEGNPQLPHRANPKTGAYKGKVVVKTVSKRKARYARAHKGA